MSAAASLGPATDRSFNTAGLANSCGWRVALSINTYREPPPDPLAASASRRSASARLLTRVCGSAACMLGERSSKTTIVSGRMPAAAPSQPPTLGRDRKNSKARTASIRQARISHSRTRACRVACLDAVSRNIIAAQGTVR